MYIRRYFFFNNDGIPFKAYTDLVGRRIVISTVLFSIAYKGNSREVTKDKGNNLRYLEQERVY